MSRLEECLASLRGRKPVEVARPGVREAAVALILVPAPDRLLLIRRADRPGDPWSGQVALPGGRREMGDPDLLGTAIRETAEEVGVVLAADQLAGRLDDLAPMTPVLPPILVRPYIFVLPAEPELRTSGEAADAEWVKLADITAPGVRVSRQIMVAGSPRTVDGFDLPIGFLWGMTERIVSPLLSAWLEQRGNH